MIAATLSAGDGDDEPSRFRCHEKAFLRGLLHPDPAERDSVRDACSSTFLCEGDTVSSSSPDSLTFDPLKLHSTITPVVNLPRTGSSHQTSGGGGGSNRYGGDNEDDTKEGEDGGDNPWARRQFSVLWAPMPGNYEGNDDLEREGGGPRAYEGQFEGVGPSMG